MKARVMDLFCGTGGFSKGFEGVGAFEVIYGIDLLASSVETFTLNHPEALGVSGDIRSIRRSEVSERLGLQPGDIDVIVGGPPCQGFSSIRPFRSRNDDDPRNSLFEEFAAYVNYFRPRVLVFENVVGLATHKSGNTLDAIESAFSDLQYDTDWRILNAAHFGVPQKRERLILIGVERGAGIRFPNPTHRGDFRTIGHLEPGRMLRPSEGGQGSFFDAHEVRDLPPALTVDDAIGDLPAIGSGEGATEYGGPPLNDYQKDRRRRSGRALALHSSTRHTERMLEIIRHSGPNINSIPSHLITSGFSSCYSRLAADEPATTITVNFVHPASNRCIHPHLDRALTPREGARLQGFDDNFEFAGSRSQIVKQIGNAVPPLLGRAVAGSVAEMLGLDLALAS